jgi:uncharacterized integral membrane protein
MKRRETTWVDALQSVGVAVVLVFAVLFAGANFVLVEVRILGLAFNTRLSWAILVALAAGVIVGVVVTHAFHVHGAWRRKRARPDVP